MAGNAEVAAYLQQAARDTDAALDSLLPGRQTSPEGDLFLAMRYSIFAGGKRLRPALFLMTLDALGCSRQQYLPFAAALEMIHTYSLIHDDLPAMDDDDLRRGRPTCHKAFGEAMAILAGDGLLSLALMLMSTPIAGAAAESQLRAVRHAAHLAGLGGMVAGQAAEVAAVAPDRDLLDYIYRGKTGALFSAASGCAAILAGAADEEIASLVEYGAQLGRAFQIIDDVLDISGEETDLGKPVGSDAKNERITYASIFGCERARQYAMQAAEAAKQALCDFDGRAELLWALPQFLLIRQG